MTVEEQVNNIQNEIAELHCGLTFEEILRVAIFMTRKVIKEIPMYTGDLNPKWKHWNAILEKFESDQKLEIDSYK